MSEPQKSSDHSGVGWGEGGEVLCEEAVNVFFLFEDQLMVYGPL